MTFYQGSDRALMKSFILLLIQLGLVGILPANIVSADAAISTRIERIQTLSTASWAIVAQGRNQPLTRTPYILAWTVTTGTAYDYFRLLNIGSISIQSFRVAITQVRLTGNGRSQEIFFERCIGGVWNPATNLCSGSISLIGRTSDAVLALTSLNLASDSFIDIRARTVPNNQSTFETTLSTQVSRSDIRLGEVRNS